MKYYVLIGLVDYEPSMVFGVFSSLELAENAKLEMAKSNHYFDEFVIKEFDLDKLN